MAIKSNWWTDIAELFAKHSLLHGNYIIHRSYFSRDPAVSRGVREVVPRDKCPNDDVRTLNKIHILANITTTRATTYYSISHLSSSSTCAVLMGALQLFYFYYYYFVVHRKLSLATTTGGVPVVARRGDHVCLCSSSQSSTIHGLWRTKIDLDLKCWLNVTFNELSNDRHLLYFAHNTVSQCLGNPANFFVF